MRNTIAILAVALTASVLAASCGRPSTLEEKLEHMRGDSVWIARLDSLAGTALGSGAKCIDAVKHTFRYDGRTWVYNQDWGGILEIPEDYVVDDDTWQVELSFHGNRVFSPDSTVMISTYAGFQPFDYDDMLDLAGSQFDDEPFVTVTSIRETEIEFKDGHVSKAVELETRTEDGIVGWARYIYANSDGVEYNISIQYPEEMEESLKAVTEMARRYPFSPDGSDPHGECI